MIKACPACGSQSFKNILNFSGVPRYNLNYSKVREDALNMELESVDFVQCVDCTFVFNRIYTQLDYRVHYDAGRSNSETFRSYLSDVARKLLKHIPKNITTVVEVGAGDCHFAYEFLKLLPVDYHAFDPSWPAGGQENTLIRYNHYYDTSCTVKPDVLVIRHVLEHISGVHDFLKTILHEQPAYILIEVPCFEFVNKKNHYDCFSHEHCSYFTKLSLTGVMNSLGYRKVFVEYIFGEEYLLSLWQKGQDVMSSKESEKNAATIHISENNNQESFDSWQGRLNDEITENSVIWGAGGKGVMLLNLLKLKYKKMPFIIDLNPNLWGMFVPGTGIEIQSPEILLQTKPNKIFILNHLYKKEIEQIVKELGLDIPVIALLSE